LGKQDIGRRQSRGTGNIGYTRHRTKTKYIVKSCKNVVGDGGKKRNLRIKEKIHCHLKFHNGQPDRDDDSRIFAAMTST